MAPLQATHGHIQRLRDTFAVLLEPNPAGEVAVASNSERQAAGSWDAVNAQGPWICPIDRHCSTDGAHPFVALRPCGHVMRERLARELASGSHGNGATGGARAAVDAACGCAQAGSSSSRTSSTDGITTMHSGRWSCPICSEPVEVDVRLYPDAATQRLVQATLLAEHEGRKKRKQHRERCGKRRAREDS